MAVTGPTAQNFPDAFVGKVTLSAYEPFPIISSTVYSSDAPASIQFIPWVQPGPVGLRNLIFPVSMNAVVPGATSQASTGSEGYSYGFTANIYSRQDYGANSTNLVTYATGSGGLTASLGYSSTSQSFVLKWATDGSGGTSQFTTTSADGNWSSFATGPKFLSDSLQPDLPERRGILAGGPAQLDHERATATSPFSRSASSCSNGRWSISAASAAARRSPSAESREWASASRARSRPIPPWRRA
jgi:hypothetical protein